MGERKVVNKYYPADFDPAKIPRWRQGKNRQMKVTMMLPMSMRCSTCGNYLYRGSKFNSRKEEVVGQRYLGIQILRFYVKCPKCSSEITFRTDPRNSDYTVESGASRNFEPWRAEEDEEERQRRRIGEEEMGDPMKSLENRTLNSKRQMDNLALLDEIKSIKSMHETLTLDSMLEALSKERKLLKEKEEEEDKALTRSVFKRQRLLVRTRIDDHDLDDF